MNRYFDRLPEEIKGLLHLVRKVAVGNNINAYLVGGCVRDLLLGVKTIDLDVVVEGDGIGFAEELASCMQAKLVRHKRFGTATVFMKQGLKIDIAMARKEVYPEPASLPVVSRGSLKDDLFRRDFTINAMAVAIEGGRFGQLIDPYGGKDDLKAKKIRVLHGLSFMDDPTRILRAARFEQRYDFKMEASTLSLLKEAVRSGILEKVEPQRIRDELIPLLKEARPVKPIRRLDKLTGFAFIHAGIRLLRSGYALLNSVEREIAWYRRSYNHRREIDAWVMYLMALLDGLNVKQAKYSLKRMAIRKGDQKRAIDYKRITPGFVRRLSDACLGPVRVFRMLEPLSYEVILLLKAKYKDKHVHKHIEDFFEIYNGMRLFISGDDLCRIGIEPGPCYQKIFTAALNAKLNGKVRTKEEELELIKKLFLKK